MCRPADAIVICWLDGHVVKALFISAITVMELDIGVRRIERRDPTQGVMLRAWFVERVLPEFQDRVLPVDTSVALRCVGLHVLIRDQNGTH